MNNQFSLVFKSLPVHLPTEQVRIRVREGLQPWGDAGPRPVPGFEPKAECPPRIRYPEPQTFTPPLLLVLARLRIEGVGLGAYCPLLRANWTESAWCRLKAPLSGQSIPVCEVTPPLTL